MIQNILYSICSTICVLKNNKYNFMEKMELQICKLYIYLYLFVIMLLPLLHVLLKLLLINNLHKV